MSHHASYLKTSKKKVSGLQKVAAFGCPRRVREGDVRLVR